MEGGGRRINQQGKEENVEISRRENNVKFNKRREHEKTGEKKAKKFESKDTATLRRRKMEKREEKSVIIESIIE